MSSFVFSLLIFMLFTSRPASGLPQNSRRHDISSHQVIRLSLFHRLTDFRTSADIFFPSVTDIGCLFQVLLLIFCPLLMRCADAATDAPPAPQMLWAVYASKWALCRRPSLCAVAHDAVREVRVRHLRVYRCAIDYATFFGGCVDSMFILQTKKISKSAHAGARWCGCCSKDDYFPEMRRA